MTTLNDWNVIYKILYYVKEHLYIFVSSFERESCEYPNFPVLLDWFRKKGHHLQVATGCYNGQAKIWSKDGKASLDLFVVCIYFFKE